MSKESAPRQISVAEMAPHVHSFLSGENKVNKISAWLIEWIKKALKSKKIKPYDKLPAKADLAFHTGVSIGTIQNVFRFVEDIWNDNFVPTIGVDFVSISLSNKIEN